MLEFKRVLTLEYLLSLIFALSSGILVLIKFRQLPDQVPFWYTREWGLSQLTDKNYTLLVPIIILVITAANAALSLKLIDRRDLTLAKAIGLITVFVNLIIYLSLYRIVEITTVKTTLPWFLESRIMIPLSLASLLSFTLTPLTISLATRFGLIDNPKTHRHPAMLLTRAVPRAGATPIIIAIITVSSLFFSVNRIILGIFLSAVVCLTVGLIDDKYDLNPYLRFASQFFSALIVAYFGLQISYINNPAGGVIPITNPSFKIDFLSPIYPIAPLAFLATLLWIIWTMNMLSWSNGVDGQFPGIVTTAAIVIGLLSIRDATQESTTLLSFITAGAVLGTAPYTWHKSHLLYGFGATSLGLILASLSILSGTKVATSLLVLMVPTLDALFTVLRRIRKKQSPFWGDRTHLHHKLLNLGFTQSQIATFYWSVSIFLGIVAAYSSGSEKMLAILTAAGAVGFLLVVVSNKGRPDAEG